MLSHTVWAAPLSQAMVPPQLARALLGSLRPCRARSGLAGHADKTSKKSWREVPIITRKNTHSMEKNHKTGFEILIFFFFFSLLCWAATLSILGVYVHIQRMRLHHTVPRVSDYGAICSAFTFFPTLRVSSVGFPGQVLDPQRLFQQRPVQRSHGGTRVGRRMWQRVAPQTGAVLVLSAPSKGERWWVRGITHIKILLFHFC